MMEAPGWTLRVVDLSGEALGSLDTCHHPEANQILTTTDASASPLARVCEREVGKAKIFRWIINASELIMTFTGREVCDESLRITADLLELIVCCTAGCQLSNWALDLSKDCVLCLFKF